MAAKKSASKKGLGKKAGAKKSGKTASKAKGVAAKKVAVAQAEAAVKKVRIASKPKNGRTLAYTQSEFVDNVRAFCGLRKRTDAKELCEDLSAFITDSLKKGYKLPLLGLGKMYVRKTKARVGRNPATGEIIHIKPKKRVRFTPAKALKEAVL